MALKVSSGKQNPRVQVTTGEGLFEETFVIRPHKDNGFLTVQRIDLDGKAHQKRTVGSHSCSCPAGRHYRPCAHADVVRAIGGIPGAKHEFQKYMEALR